MPKHKTEDYKLSAVKYYLRNNFSIGNMVCFCNFILFLCCKR